MGEVVDNASSTVSIGGRKISKLRYANVIQIGAGSDTELTKLVQSLDSISRKYGMKINAKKDKSDDQQQKWLPK